MDFDFVGLPLSFSPKNFGIGFVGLFYHLAQKWGKKKKERERERERERKITMYFILILTMEKFKGCPKSINLKNNFGIFLSEKKNVIDFFENFLYFL